MADKPPVRLGLSTPSEIYDEMQKVRAEKKKLMLGKDPAKSGPKGKKKGKRKPRKPNLILSKIHITKQKIEVAERGELIFLFSAPIWFVLVYLMHRFEVSRLLQAFGVIFLGFYTGWFFAVWVFLERRVGEQGWLRYKNAGLRLMEDRDRRAIAVREAEKVRAEAARQAAEALRLGREKAQLRAAAPDSAALDSAAPDSAAAIALEAPPLDDLDEPDSPSSDRPPSDRQTSDRLTSYTPAAH